MRYSTILPVAMASAAFAYTPAAPEPAASTYEPAAAIYDNPLGAEYKATFDGDKGVEGYITFNTATGGAGVDIAVELKGFTDETGPFGYHIHDQPVPEDGNCTGTKAHLDPYSRGQTPACDDSKPETCEVGDLAGKFGKIPVGSDGRITYSKKYHDMYISTKEGIGAFVGNRSIVIHRPDATRLVCVNLMPVVPTTPEYPTPVEPEVPLSTASGAPVPIQNSTAPTTPASTGTGYPLPITNNTLPAVPAEPSFPTYVGSAGTYGVSVAAALGGLLAVMFTL